MDYYHGNLSKQDAERLLTDYNKDGAFLVRDSEGITGAYVLCLWSSGKVYYYRILSNAEGMFYIQSEQNVTPLSGHSLDNLISECVRHEVRNGLVTALRYAIRKPISSPPANSNVSTDSSVRRAPNDSTQLSANSPSGQLADSPSHGHSTRQLVDHDYVNDDEPTDETAAYYARRFRRLDLSAFDSVFACRLKAYVENELQADVDNATGRNDTLTPTMTSSVYGGDAARRGTGPCRLEKLNCLLVDTANELAHQLATYRAQLDAVRELFCDTIAESSSGTGPRSGAGSLEQLLESCAALKSETENLQRDAVKSIRAFVTNHETVYDDMSTQILPSANYYEAQAQAQQSLKAQAKPPLKPKPSVTSTQRALSTDSRTNSVDDAESIKTSNQTAKPAPLAIPQRVFQVRSAPKRGQVSQFLLTVDIDAGLLHIHQVRPSRDALELRGSFTHAQIEQLVKSPKDDATRLELRASQNGRDVRETLVFADKKQREIFCQLIEQTKTRHQSRTRLERISVFVGTWNMANEACDWNVASWLRSQGDGLTRSKTVSLLAHDVYVIGVQECALGKDDLVKRLRQAFRGFLNEELELVEVVSMWSLRLVVLTRYEHRNRISDVQHFSVPTGLGKTIGNKGAVAVCFNFNQTSFLFVNAHLPSGDERTGKRNSDFKHIFRQLNAKSKTMSGVDITHQYQYVFWFGDLNYRIQEQLGFILDKCAQRLLPALLERDQLRLCQQNKEAFSIFSEAPIDFPPTYRYRKQSRDQFAYEKYSLNGAYRVNAPAYTDRVLYHAAVAELHQLVHCTSYGMSPNVCTSDHKPVFSSFDVYLVNEPLATIAPIRQPNSTRDIIFELGSIESTFAASPPHRSYVVEVHSSVLLGCIQSKPTTQFANNAVISQPVQSGVVVAPVWTSSAFPTLEPTSSQIEQLREACLIFAIKTGPSSADECVGSALLPLRSFFDAYDRSAETVQKSYFFFKLKLVNCGDDVGCLRGALRFAEESRFIQRSKSSASQSKRSEAPSAEPTYQPIYVDTDEVVGMHKQPFVVEEISSDELAVPTDVQLVDLSDSTSVAPSTGRAPALSTFRSAFNPVGRFCDVDYSDSTRLGQFNSAIDSD